jgi:Xaa-Pro aminopeptidase
VTHPGGGRHGQSLKGSACGTAGRTRWSLLTAPRRPVAAATERGALALEALALDREVVHTLPDRFGEGRSVAVASGEQLGTWSIDKFGRFCLLAQDDEPIIWDFGSAARHHELHAPWIGDGRSRAGISTLRGSFIPEMGRAEDVAHKIKVELEHSGLLGEPVGVDIAEPAVFFALEREGVQVVDGQQLMQEARKIKTQDEILLLNAACMMVDAAYDELYQAIKPGIRENECVALASKVLYDLGSEHVEGVNAISGERCSPHPHLFSDRVLRPGDPAFFDILHSFGGYRTCYYRTFAVGSASRALVDAYKRCRYYLDVAIEAIRPGVTTAEVVELWPMARDFGFPNEEAAFALQFGHGIGLSIWEKPHSVDSSPSTTPR